MHALNNQSLRYVTYIIMSDSRSILSPIPEPKGDKFRQPLVSELLHFWDGVPLRMDVIDRRLNVPYYV